jgi:hypothetical protein
VLAVNDGSGPALEVQGPATFSRSGLATIAAKKKSVTVSFPGVTATSMVLATLQTIGQRDRRGGRRARDRFVHHQADQGTQDRRRRGLVRPRFLSVTGDESGSRQPGL